MPAANETSSEKWTRLYAELNERVFALREELKIPGMTDKEFMHLPQVDAVYEWYHEEHERWDADTKARQINVLSDLEGKLLTLRFPDGMLTTVEIFSACLPGDVVKE